VLSLHSSSPRIQRNAEKAYGLWELQEETLYVEVGCFLLACKMLTNVCQEITSAAKKTELAELASCTSMVRSPNRADTVEAAFKAGGAFGQRP